LHKNENAYTTVLINRCLITPDLIKVFLPLSHEMRKEGREDSNLSKATQKRKLCLHNTLTLWSTPHPSFRLTCLWVVLQTKVNKNPCLQKKKEKKDNLIAGAVPLVRSRSWQSSVIVTLAEARCAVVPEQEQAEPGGEGWNS